MNWNTELEISYEKNLKSMANWKKEDLIKLISTLTIDVRALKYHIEVLNKEDI